MFFFKQQFKNFWDTVFHALKQTLVNMSEANLSKNFSRGLFSVGKLSVNGTNHGKPNKIINNLGNT